MAYRSTPFTRFMRRLHAWVERRDDQRHKRFMEEAFPVGSRVALTGECCTVSEKWPGRHGTVLAPVLDAGDYHVQIDGDTDRYQYVCPKGMRRM